MHHQGNHQQYQEDVEEDLRYASGAAGNSTKSESSGNKRDHKERQSPTEHN
jgi:hypothetical protein